MLRYFWKPFCEVFDFLSATHSRRGSTYSLVSGEKWLICLIFAVCHSTNTFFYFSWEDQEPLALKVCAHSSRFPASQLPHSHFYWYRLVYSIDFLDSFGSFSFSSLCLIFIFPCDSSNPWFPVLCLPILPCFLHCFDIYSFQLFFFLSICRWCFPFSPNEILLWPFSLFTLTSSYTHILTMTIITIILYRSSSYFFFLYLVWTPPLQILPSLIEWPLSCDHLFPLPLLFSFPSLYLARRTSFPPWVQQTPVWKLKVEGEALEER